MRSPALKLDLSVLLSCMIVSGRDTAALYSFHAIHGYSRGRPVKLGLR